MINIDFSKIIGPIKPAHGVGNGPLNALARDKSKEFREARIPFSRLHDTAGQYGSGIFVNIHCIFPNFDADVNDPKSYYFEATDLYINAIINAGTQVYYRLGETIENSKLLKIFVRPPKDYLKWAQICEHIIMHYNEGWADGFHHNIKYWEVWCEPDNPSLWADATPEQYYELYYVTSNHLKNRFPDMKIGGYSASGFYSTTREKVSKWFGTLVPFMHGFFEYITREDKKSPLDFFSWHCYTTDPKEIGEHARFVDEQLKKYGFENSESILAEWNYALTWDYEDVKKRKSIFGAAMNAACIMQMQNSSIDVGMYYDSEITRSNYCGLFDYNTSANLKPYYALYYFGKLFCLGTQTEADADDEDIFIVSACDGTRAGVYITNFSDDLREETIEITGDYQISEMLVTNAYVTNEKTEGRLACADGKINVTFKPYELMYIEFEKPVQ